MIDHEFDEDQLTRLSLDSGDAQFERLSEDRVIVTFFDKENDCYCGLTISSLGTLHVEVEEG